MTDIWVHYWLGNKIQDPLTFSTRIKYQMNINGRHFHVCHSFGISSTGMSSVETVRDGGVPYCRTTTLTLGFSAISRGELRKQDGEQSWKGWEKRKGRNKPKQNKTDIHILWIKNPAKGKRETSPTIDRILNAVNLSFNIYSNRKIEP